MKSRRTVSKGTFTFDGLRRRLSNRADSALFEGAQAQAEVSDTFNMRHSIEVLNPMIK